MKVRVRIVFRSLDLLFKHSFDRDIGLCFRFRALSLRALLTRVLLLTANCSPNRKAPGGLCGHKSFRLPPEDLHELDPKVQLLPSSTSDTIPACPLPSTEKVEPLLPNASQT